MNLINKHLDKNNLHHAYLIEGKREEIFPLVIKFMKEIGVETIGNPDFSHMIYDNLNIEDARNLKSKSLEKGFSSGLSKKIYIISANNLLLEAQNTLLKMFEEPIENTHFFLIIPEVDVLLKTLVSRFYLIKTKISLESELKEVEKFISMAIKDRILFIKELLTDEEDEEENAIVSTNTPKSKALKFLNALEFVLHNKMSKTVFDIYSDVDFFEQIFKAREFLRQPGSSSKSLMEAVALSVPVF